MNAITYRNTQTNLPGWVKTVHVEQSLGYAYETDTHFVHLYGRDNKFFTISVGLTAIEKKSGSLEDWVKRVFGAEDIQPLKHEVGCSVEGVWRPSLYYYEDTYQALNNSALEMRLAEQSLRLLVNKLDELFLFIEPDNACLNAYSHKTRELLILACTEVENSWKSYMNKSSKAPLNGKTFTTKDYVALGENLFLNEYEFSLKSYGNLSSIIPFKDWDKAAPSKSLPWYEAYNLTKHDRAQHLSKATLGNCILAVLATLVLHCVKFSPFSMFEGNTTFTSLINQHFDCKLTNCSPTSFYLPKFSFPTTTRGDLFVFDPHKSGYSQPFAVSPLTL